MSTTKAQLLQLIQEQLRTIRRQDREVMEAELGWKTSRQRWQDAENERDAWKERFDLLLKERKG